MVTQQKLIILLLIPNLSLVICICFDIHIFLKFSIRVHIFIFLYWHHILWIKFGQRGLSGQSSTLNATVAIVANRHVDIV